MNCHASSMRQLLTLLLMLTCPALSAADRALLIGVGDYSAAVINDLPGIDQDIDTMRSIARDLGFHEVRVLQDTEATYTNVRRALGDWLVRGMDSSDRVLIYFSGHGSFIPDADGDEADQRDEVLLLHDSDVVKHNGRNTLVNALVDDRFAQLLKAIPSEHIVVLVDACHSGTSTRSLRMKGTGLAVSEGIEKFFSYPGMPSTRPSSFGKDVALQTNERERVNYVLLSAADEDEKSIATGKGSLFTLGLAYALEQSAKRGETINLSGLRRDSEAFIAAMLRDQPKRIHHPQLDGSKDLAQQPMRLTAASTASSNWERYAALPATGGGALVLRVNQTEFSDGERLTIQVDLPREGYLNVINVGPDDAVTLLYPNQWEPKNHLSAGTLALPTATMGFDLVAGAPYGRSLLVALYTTKPHNFYRTARELSKAPETFNPGFASPQAISVRSFRAEPKRQVWAGKLITRVCPAAGCTP